MSQRYPTRDPGDSQDSLRQRLAAYARYVALVRAQEEALEEGDLERHAELGEAREEIQSELGAAPSEHELSVASRDPEARALLEGTLSSLRSALARDERMRRNLASLRNETGGKIRTMGARRCQVHNYLQGSGAVTEPRESKLNRKG